MASYKDNSPLQFSPYVQTTPVEAMAKVGMYKQQRYEQGVQKIQQSIDNIAGLDIARPEDKQYLQSKLNQLGSQLSMVAGGDFSNFSLVNSVNGMTNQIVKDPNVMRAVSNTAKYKKDLSIVEKHQQDGKWSPSNQTAFQKDVSKWFNGGTDANYNANVSPYHNVQEESQKIIKGLAADVTNNEVKFIYGNDGTTIVGVRDVITKETIKELTPEKIQTALKAGLSPQAWRQLSIDGQYKYSNTTSNDFINQINSGYKNRFRKLSEKRSEIENVLKNVGPEHKQDLQNRLDQIDSMIRADKREYDSLSAGFEEGDVESAKSQFYTMKWMENISSSFSTRDYDVDTKVSPYFEVKYKKDMQNLAFAKYEEEKKNNRVMQALKKREVDALEEANRSTGKSFTLPRGSKSTKDILEDNELEVNTLKETYTNNRKNIASLMEWDDTVSYIDVNNDGVYSEGDTLATREKGGLTEFDRMMAIAKNNQYKTIQASSRSDVMEYIKSEQKFNTALFRNAIVSEEVNKQLPLDINKLVPEEYKNMTWEGFTAEETANLLLEFENKYKTFKATSGGISPTTGISSSSTTIDYNDEAALKDLTPQEFTLYQNVFRAKDPMAIKLLNSVRPGLNKIKSERNDLKSRLLLKTIPQEQGVAVPLLVDKKPVANALQSILGNIDMVISNQGGWQKTDLTSEEVMAIKDGLKDASFITDTQELRVSGGGYNRTIPLTNEQFYSLANQFKIQVDKSPEVRYFDDNYLERLLATNPSINEKGFWTTATPDFKGGTSQRNTTFQNAYLQKVDFPSVEYMNVSGNIITKQNPRENFDEAYLQLNVKIGEPKDIDGDGTMDYNYERENIEIPVPFSKAELSKFLRTLTDESLFKFITGRDMSMKDFKNLQNQKINIPK